MRFKTNIKSPYKYYLLSLRKDLPGKKDCVLRIVEEFLRKYELFWLWCQFSKLSTCKMRTDNDFKGNVIKAQISSQ